MAEWIEKQANQIKAQEESERRERDWQLYKRQLITEQWESAWRSIQMATRRQVDLFNGKFPDEPQKHIALTDERDFGFTLQWNFENITRVVQPSARLADIHLRIIVTSGTDRRFTEQDYRFGATTDGDVGMASNGGIKPHDEAAETILRHLF